MLNETPESDNAPTPPRRPDGTQHHWPVLIALLIVTPAGLLTKFTLPAWLDGPAGRWCELYGAAVLYEVFWVLVLRLIWPHSTVWRCAATVLLMTGLLEFSQRWHPPALDAVRRTLVGAALLGNGFDWWDFPHYVLGSVAGGLLAKWLARDGLDG